MAYPRTKGTDKGNKAKQKRQGVALTNTGITKDTLLSLIQKYSGNLSQIADAIGTTRGTVRKYCDRDTDLGQALLDARERMIDELEDSCWQRAVESKDTTLQLFLLKTQGRHRGYDQDEGARMAKDIAAEAFAFITNQTKSPVTDVKTKKPKD